MAHRKSRPLDLAIGARFLQRTSSEGGISLITLLALAGVTLGVGALVVALSLMNGYRTNLVRAMSGALPHLTLTPYESQGFADPQALRQLVERTVAPVLMSPQLQQETLLSNPAKASAPVMGVSVQGIQPEGEGQSEAFLWLIQTEATSGQPRLEEARAVLARLSEPGPGGSVGVLISPALAEKLGVGLGEALAPLSFPEGGETFLPLPLKQRLVVRGFFQTGIQAFDEMAVLADLDQMIALFGLPAGQWSLGVRLREPLEAGAAAEAMRAVRPDDGNSYSVYSWLEVNQGLFKLIQTQKTMLGLVLMLIVVIAFFGMVSAMVMLVFAKSREIAALKALGAPDGLIRRLFFWQGLFIGVMGLALGLVVGLALCWALLALPLIDIPAGVYPGSDRVPVRVEVMDLLWVSLATLGVSLVATLYPAGRAARVHPVEGLRQEG